jgi:hypothetical protein
MLYKDFDVNGNYDLKNDYASAPAFIPTIKWAEKKASTYLLQDRKRERDTTKNITAAQIMQFFKSHHECYLCHTKFTVNTLPTLDRIDNEIAHTLNNVEPCCELCNTTKSDKDKDFAQYKIQLRKYCLLNSLPMTLTDETTYHILRDGITGGLSNVGHRLNYAGITHINKLSFQDGQVFSQDNDNVMTHITGCDFSSLYPSVFSSNPHPFNPYTKHKMYMPGYQLKRYNPENSSLKERLDVINNPSRFECTDQSIVDKLPYFVAVIKGHVDNDFINDFINFPPIIKKLEVTTDTNTISKYMYEHMVSNKLSTDKKEKKLTQLLSTHDQFMSFGMYELWFLIDECHFIIDDIDNLITFTRHDKFGFVNHFFNDRVNAKKEGNTGRSILDKIVLNGSYGSDGQNNEKFTTIKFLNRDKTIKAHANYNFKATHKVTDDLFIVEKEPTSASCKKPLQSAFATLSNAKFW